MQESTANCWLSVTDHNERSLLKYRTSGNRDDGLKLYFEKRKELILKLLNESELNNAGKYRIYLDDLKLLNTEYRNLLFGFPQIIDIIELELLIKRTRIGYSNIDHYRLSMKDDLELVGENFDLIYNSIKRAYIDLNSKGWAIDNIVLCFFNPRELNKRLKVGRPYSSVLK